jgi:hypothetical protein
MSRVDLRRPSARAVFGLRGGGTLQGQRATDLLRQPYLVAGVHRAGRMPSVERVPDHGAPGRAARVDRGGVGLAARGRFGDVLRGATVVSDERAYVGGETLIHP